MSTEKPTVIKVTTVIYLCSHGSAKKGKVGFA